MARMRTITKTIEYLKEKDPESAISEWWIRQMVRTGQLKHHKAGNKYLINLDYLEEYLKNPPDEEEQNILKTKSGTIRQIK